MIVPMKKVTLLCLENQKVSALKKLRDLGIMQLVVSGGKSDASQIADPAKEAADAQRVCELLQNTVPASGTEKSALSAREIVQHVLKLQEQQTQLNNETESLKRDLEKLLPWGDFNPADICRLQDQGVYVYLCSSPKKDFKTFSKNASQNSDIVIQTISYDKIFCHYIVISQKPLDKETLDLTTLPDTSLSQINQKLAEAKAKQSGIQKELGCFVHSLPELQNYCSVCEEKLEFVQAENSMEQAGEITYLKGYVPAPDLEIFRAAALEAGWGFLAEDPAEVQFL